MRCINWALKSGDLAENENLGYYSKMIIRDKSFYKLKNQKVAKPEVGSSGFNVWEGYQAMIELD